MWQLAIRQCSSWLSFVEAAFPRCIVEYLSWVGGCQWPNCQRC
jgi:hypothetical protein